MVSSTKSEPTEGAAVLSPPRALGGSVGHEEDSPEVDCWILKAGREMQPGNPQRPCNSPLGISWGPGTTISNKYRAVNETDPILSSGP